MSDATPDRTTTCGDPACDEGCRHGWCPDSPLANPTYPYDLEDARCPEVGPFGGRCRKTLLHDGSCSYADSVNATPDRVLATMDDPHEAYALMRRLRASGPRAWADMREVRMMPDPPRTANRWAVVANEPARSFYWREVERGRE